MTRLGLSPCPNDTFIFHALLEGIVKTGFSAEGDLQPVFADVQELNIRARNGELPFTKISAGVIPAILEKYCLLNSGAALGWGCGPLVISKNPDFDPASARIAIPGVHTTANMLLDLHGGFGGERIEMLFSDIIPAVAAGEIETGVIIHEGRFTYSRENLHLALDLGEWWEEKYHMPLPLGVIAARRDLPVQAIAAMQAAISESIRYARVNPEASARFVASHAQELEPEVTKAHIDTFVTDFSIGLGDAGKKAIRQLLAASGHSGQNIFFGE